MPDKVAGSDRTYAKVYLVVAHYFAILSLKLRRKSSGKMQCNAARQKLTGCSYTSRDFKNQIISALPVHRSTPEIGNYKLKVNYQSTLFDDVETNRTVKLR